MGEALEPPWLSIVGLGEDGLVGLSAAAEEAIRRATLVVGGQRHLALASQSIRGATLAWRSPIEATFPAILERRGRPTCVLATGDPFCFGIGSVLARHVSPDEITCWPQLSAFSLLAARLGWALQDCRCVSLHGRALSRIIPVLHPGARVLALSWDGTTPSRLAQLLSARGFGGTRMIVGEALGGPRQRLRTCRADHFDLDDVADLNTIALEVAADPNARARPLAPGFPDDWFEHDGQITKAPVRAVTLSALRPMPRALLWDIGAGSGSISVEWLLSDDSLRAAAVEHNEARAARIRRNAEHWGVAERLTLDVGRAPETLPDTPPPDAIFVGGGVTAPGLIQACCGALRQGGRLVVNAVTIESQALLAQAYRDRGGDLMTMSFAQAEPVGGFHGLRPAMTVMQWRWQRL